MALLYLWTRECELGISDLKYERKALSNTAKKFGVAVSKLPTVLARGAWKSSDESMMPVHRLRIENMITVCIISIVTFTCVIVMLDLHNLISVELDASARSGVFEAFVLFIPPSQWFVWITFLLCWYSLYNSITCKSEHFSCRWVCFWEIWLKT